MGIAAVAGADGGGTGSIGARCSAETSDAPITGPTASVSVVSTAEMDRCVVDIGWDGGNLAVKSLRVVGIGSRPTAQRVDTTLWIGAGSYDLSLVMPDGTVMSESAAITLLLADITGKDSLVPAPGWPTAGCATRWRSMS